VSDALKSVVRLILFRTPVGVRGGGH
jgi:hypothetical protein